MIPAHLFSVPQLWGYVGLIAYILSYFITDDRRLKVAFSASNLFWIMHYWLVGAETAAITTLIITLRNLLSLNADRKSLSWRFAMAWFCSAILIAVGMLTWEGLASLTVVVTCVVVTWAMFFTQGLKMRLIFVGVDCGWFCNALLITSYSGLIYAIGSISANLYTITRMVRARSSAG